MKYCTRCCMPETAEGITFDKDGVCDICLTHDAKEAVNWIKRRNMLDKILVKTNQHYDCLVPISGGKDSVWQLHVVCEENGLNPLTVTFCHSWMTETGKYNLQNALEKFNVDNILFTPNRKLVNQSALQSTRMMGDLCWLCHYGCGSWPLQIAVKFGIPLIVYGEPPHEGYSNPTGYDDLMTYTKEHFLDASAHYTPETMSLDVGPCLSLPTAEEFDQAKIKGIFIGDYIFWDEQRQTEYVMEEYGWKDRDMNTYKRYKSVDCQMAGLHDYMCYLKRGFGRATFQVNVDVRHGRLTREEGFEIIKKYDHLRPDCLDEFLKITGMTEEGFQRRMVKNENHNPGNTFHRGNNRSKGK